MAEHWDDGRESGTYEAESQYETTASQRVEAFARLAYTIRNRVKDMADPINNYDLLRRLVKPAPIERVDLGVPGGGAKLTFSDASGDGDVAVCTSVLLPGGQTDAMLSMSCARACAHYVEWVAGERFPAGLLQAVTLAIAMPEPAFREEMGYLSVAELAEAYMVLPEHVLQRMRMLRGAHDSSERPAFTSAAT
jgi:hypothetical protein